MTGWTRCLEHGHRPDQACWLADELRRGLDRSRRSRRASPARAALAYRRTAKRTSRFATGRPSPCSPRDDYLNKDNADCVRDPSPSAGCRTTSATSMRWAITCWLLPAADRRGRHGAARCWSASCRSAGGPISTSRGWAAGSDNQEGQRTSATDRRHPRPRPQPGGHHGRPLRHRLHGGPLRAGVRRRRRAPGRRRAPTTTTRPRPR